MENNLSVFMFEGANVRVLEINREPWFVAKDVCLFFDDKNHNRSVGRVDQDDKKLYEFSTAGGKQKLTVVNESGLYALLFAMQPQKAHKGVSDEYPLETVERIAKLRRFKRWVTSEVLPSIRKHGGYIAGQENHEMTDAELLAKAMTVANSVLEQRAQRIAALEAENNLLDEQNKTLLIANEAANATIAQMKPKADYYDQILSCKNTMNAEQIAKDYGMSARSFNVLLNEMKIQFKSGNQWVLYQTYADKGYTRSETYIYDNGFVHNSTVRTKWTQEGRIFLYEILKKRGILPTCERVNDK